MEQNPSHAPTPAAHPPRRIPDDVLAARRRARSERDRDVAALADRQHGAVSRRQLAHLGVHRDVVRRRLLDERWVERSTEVISTTTGPPSAAQLRWIGLLHPRGPAALAGRSALAEHGLRGWEAETVTVIVSVERHLDVPDVTYFRSRRPFVDWSRRRDGHLVLDVEPAALLLAAYSTHPRTAVGVVAACVQQRLTTADRLQAFLGQLPALPRRRMLADALEDIAGGSHSVTEVDVLRMCRAAGLEPPVRQRARTDARGVRRWTDAEWDLPDGTVLVLEIDGAFHMDAREWTADKRRHRGLVAPGRVVVGCTSYEVRVEPEALVADLVALGVPVLGLSAA